MNENDFFTPESILEFKWLISEATGPGQRLFERYREEREAQVESAPDLRTWIDALEDGDLAAATDSGLWARMAEQGFIEFPTPRTHYSAHGVFVCRIISPKVFDAFRTGDGPRSDYVFTTVKVCLRRDAVPRSLEVPARWRDPALIDTELFELPAAASEDMFDDLEKITSSTWRRPRVDVSSASRCTSALGPGSLRTGPRNGRPGAGSASTATTSRTTSTSSTSG